MKTLLFILAILTVLVFCKTADAQQEQRNPYQHHNPLTNPMFAPKQGQFYFQFNHPQRYPQHRYHQQHRHHRPHYHYPHYHRYPNYYSPYYRPPVIYYPYGNGITRFGFSITIH